MSAVIPAPSPVAPAASELLDHQGRERTPSATNLTYEQARLGTAFHEAGHAVLALAYGMRVLTSQVIAWIPEPGVSRVTGRTDVQAQASFHLWRFAAQAAAGQVAQVRYLMAYGLWTPERAAACAADHDRDQAVDVLTEYGHCLGIDHVPHGGKSWGMVRGMASRKVGYLWPEIRTVAHAMNEHTVLTGDEISALTGLPNAPFEGGAA
ncbi:hypothetical protein AQI95_10430 [Streptomyces yokosukanensis]|uniref:Peptidase M41 domain-containing protein n=1 Tax=Streptomyces yokosukanensis TaxID=67386 RepID=A0A101P9L6_9ACTN|nr:hypothetical protein [Streptomyces yokosukanensis]KUN07440.1 hypothetical protein AQI95_10430 [Streptomyces yokosukanensis]